MSSEETVTGDEAGVEKSVEEHLSEALARVDVLEKKLDEAIDLILKRDDQLSAAERKVLDLEEKLESLGVEI